MNYYFLGIGGIGMSAIARYLPLQVHTVSGYDRTPSPLTAHLQEEGIPVHFDDNPSLIPADVDQVVYTPAAEYQYLLKKGVPIVKRAQFLGQLTQGKRCIAVAGTHGKTSTSTLIAHMLSQTELGCSALLGGISKNFNSNIHVDNASDYVVVEADEYDRSFLHLHPWCAVITATDPDHLDTYGTHAHLIEAFHQFASQIDPAGTLVIKQGLTLQPDHSEHESEHEHEHHHGASIEGIQAATCNYTSHGIEADYYPWNVRQYNGNIFFDLRTPKGVFYDLELPNAALYKTRDLVFIDDYAHHPQEIAACLDSIRFLYPGKRVVGIFQPHLYTRTRDFADQFAQVLSTLDELIMLPIYPAREKPLPGVTSSMVLRKIDSLSKYLCTPDQVLELVPALCPDVVVTMGAGDIDRLVPRLEEVLKSDNPS